MAGVAIATLCVLNCASVAPQNAAPSQKPGTISGHIYRADTGAPLAKAIVSLEPAGNDPQHIQFTKTDENGAYVFTGIGPGQYNVQAERNGFVTAPYAEPGKDSEPKTIILNSEQSLDGIDLRLKPTGTISGTVVDEDNDPVRGLLVAAIRPAYRPGGVVNLNSDMTGFASTDDLGHYRLTGLEAGSYYVQVDGDSRTRMVRRVANYGVVYYPQASSLSDAQRIRVAPGAEVSDINFVMTAQLHPYTISGTVSNPAPNAGERAAVQVRQMGTAPGDSGGFVSGATVKPDGSFAIPGVPAGDYLLWASQEQYLASKLPGPTMVATVASGSAPVHIQDEDVKVNVVMERSGEVRGTVTWEGGVPAEAFKTYGVHLMLWGALNQDVNGYGYGPLDKNGGFDIQYVPAGRYIFATAAPRASLDYLKQVQCSGADYTMQPLTIESGTVLSNCTLTLATDTAVISGQVLDGDKPVRGLEVVAIPQSTDLRRFPAYSKQAAATTDSNGQFKIPDVIPGDYLLFAVPPDPEQSYYALAFADRNAGSAEPVTVKPREAKTINLKPTRTPQ